jgi:hypothetical protein
MIFDEKSRKLPQAGSDRISATANGCRDTVSGNFCDFSLKIIKIDRRTKTEMAYF